MTKPRKYVAYLFCLFAFFMFWRFSQSACGSHFQAHSMQFQDSLNGESSLKTVNIIRYGILLTAGGISHLQPNLQNFGLGTVSTLALEVIISLAFFWLLKLFMSIHISFKNHTCKKKPSYFFLVNGK